MFESRPNRDAEVIFVGRSNVGKSTLMRELTGHDVPVGQRPGVTQQPNHYDWTSTDFLLTDMPGFGFMSGVPEDQREAILDGIVEYLETNAHEILLAVIVLDGKAAVDIIDRHTNEEEIPHTIEFFDFLDSLDVPAVLCVNKMDKVEDRDDRLNDIADRFGLLPPWKQWPDTIAPISAKRSRIDSLTDAVHSHLEEEKREELKQYF